MKNRVQLAGLFTVIVGLLVLIAYDGGDREQKPEHQFQHQAFKLKVILSHGGDLQAASDALCRQFGRFANFQEFSDMAIVMFSSRDPKTGKRYFPFVLRERVDGSGGWVYDANYGKVRANVTNLVELAPGIYYDPLNINFKESETVWFKVTRPLKKYEDLSQFRVSRSLSPSAANKLAKAVFTNASAVESPALK